MSGDNLFCLVQFALEIREYFANSKQPSWELWKSDCVIVLILKMPLAAICQHNRRCDKFLSNFEEVYYKELSFP